jgi:uncharacterized protein YbjT (DUF2867 family)
MTILVIGARGSVGRHVVDLLLTAGEQVRASVRDRATADLPEAVAVVQADLADAPSLAVAMQGVRRVFLYAPPDGTGAVVTAARDAGLERVVLLSSGSVLLPYAQGNPIAEHHRAVERALTGAGLPLVAIRPLVLAGNALNWARSIRGEGVVRLVHPGAMTAPIHERDIAAVAVAALLGAAGPGVSDMLTGPELISQRDQVAAIAAATGRDVRVEELSEAQAREHFGRFEDPATVAAILHFIRTAAEGLSPATDAVRRELGRPGVPFAAWAQDHAADFR